MRLLGEWRDVVVRGVFSRRVQVGLEATPGFAREGVLVVSRDFRVQGLKRSRPKKFGGYRRRS
jgi:hypothetical protein